MTDEELMALLAEHFGPLGSEPPDAVLCSLRDAAAARARLAPAIPRAQKRLVWRPYLAWVAAAAVLISSGSAYAAVKGVPDPVRNAAHAFGLPVAPAAVTDLHDAERRLQTAIDRHDQAAASRAVEDVTERLSNLSKADLSKGERTQEHAAAEALLDRAKDLDTAPAGQPAPGAQAATGAPAAPGAQAAPVGAAPPSTTTDDRVSGSPAPPAADPPEEVTAPPTNQPQPAAPPLANTPASSPPTTDAAANPKSGPLPADAVASSTVPPAEPDDPSVRP